MTDTMSRPLTLTEVLTQDRVWIRGQLLAQMDRHHRANLIPFLRRNRCTLYAAATKTPGEDFTDVEAEEWLEATPLMRRLVELEAGRPIEERRETHVRNQAHEAATGYQKIDLRPGYEVECHDCHGSGDVAQAVDWSDAVGCPTCNETGRLWVAVGERS